MKNFPFNVDTTSYPASKIDYYQEASQKTRICLHHTAGNSAEGAITTLREPNYVMVHFLVDKQGNIFQFMPLDSWAFHMGIKDTYGKYDRSTIGIEIVNVGPLVLGDNDRLCFWPNSWNAKYCTLSDDLLYYKTDESWRGFNYFATYNSAQYDSVAKLVAYLCVLLNITPAIFAIDNKFYNCNLLDNFSGIFTHNNVRTDKTDLSPAWNFSFWGQLLQAAHYNYVQDFASLNNPFI